MRHKALVGIVGVVALVWLGSQTASGQGASAREIPVLQPDPGWLKMPNGWVMGVVSAVSVDKHDNVWILHRPRDVAEAQRAHAAPSVLEFDKTGKFLKGWGWPDTKELWPKREHCMYVDADDNVWIGGTWRTATESDDYIQKFSPDGKLLLQIGKPDSSKGPQDTANLHGAADLFVLAKTHEVFVADEGNLRVAVYDANTGAYKRMWAGYGDMPPATLPKAAPAGAAGGQGAATAPAAGPLPRAWGAVHAVQVSDDGIVYVGDRANRRIQLFSLDGKYQRELTDMYASGMTFSRDPAQRFLYVADSTGGGIEQVQVLDRKTMTPLTRFGREGTAPGEFQGPHVMAVDSANNLYVTEVAPGNRLQRFAFKGLSRAQ